MFSHFKRRLLFAWHGLVLLLCVAGILVSAKLCLGFLKASTVEDTADDPAFWFIALVLLLAVVIGLAWEAWRRIKMLRLQKTLRPAAAPTKHNDPMIKR